MCKSIDEFWKEFYEKIQLSKLSVNYVSYSKHFRGVSNQSYELIPSIGRNNIKAGTHGNINFLEDRLIREFKRLSIPELEKIPTSDMEWLFLAQHYGLPTRLLDWSSNPLVALFFAVYKDDDTDGALYIADHMLTDQYENFDFKTATSHASQLRSELNFLMEGEGKAIFIRPKYTDQRYLNQKSIFSCSADPFVPLELKKCHKLIINKEHKFHIRQSLRAMGISHSHIYPGIDGIAKEIKSEEFNIVIQGKEQIISAEMKFELP